MPPIEEFAEKKESWDAAWETMYSHYVGAPPRQGKYLEFMFPRRISTLEIGAGSMRDAAYLASLGYDSSGGDFSPASVAIAKKHFAGTGLKTLELDAFSTCLADDAYDLTFHNGLIIYFNDDSRVKALLKEQARITKRWMVTTVHCGHNDELVADFAKRKATDPLFDIRFYKISELQLLLGEIGPTRFYAFGASAVDRRLFRRLHRALPGVLRRRLFEWQSSQTDPRQWERIMAVTSLGGK